MPRAGDDAPETAGAVPIAPLRRVLVLTSTDLRGEGIGALFLRDLLASVPETSFEVICERPFLLLSARGSLAWIVHRWNGVLMRLAAIHPLRLWLFRRLRLPIVLRRLRRRMAGADCMQVLISSAEHIYILERLIDDRVDVRIMVLDDMSVFLEDLKLPRHHVDALKASFGEIVRRAGRVAVISSAMNAEYRQKYGRPSEIIRHGIDLDRPLSVARSHDGIRIVFAGSLYAKMEWNAFVAALESAGWRLGDRPVELSFMGDFPLAGARRPRRVAILGRLPFAEALQVMATMDIGYLPYWFDRRHEAWARTSFAGKMSAYAAAGLAVFHHAPAYTDLTAFLDRYPFGVSCPSLEAPAILAQLERLVRLKDGAACAAARELAFATELSQQAMSRRFRNFLGPRAVP